MTNPRLLLIDDNVRGVGGHFFELMSLLGRGGNQFGWDVHAAVHQSFDADDQLESGLTVHKVFRTRRMVRWSLGVDGESRVPRRTDGRYLGSIRQRWSAEWFDFIRVPSKRSAVMFDRWRDDVAGWLRQMDIQETDRVVLTTADDFSLLAIGDALRGTRINRLQLKALVHFALVGQHTDSPASKLRVIGRQLDRSAEGVSQSAGGRHSIELFSTTPSLAEQYRRTGTSLPVRDVAYPSRTVSVRDHRSKMDGPVRCGLAGLPRAEKGRGQITTFLDACTPLFEQQQCTLAAQMPADRWQRLVPRHLRDKVVVNGDLSDAVLDIQTNNFSTTQYHRWLDSIELGIFLYDAQRYEVRCSGIAIELMIRGIPVVVPDQCHMADEVRRYGGHGWAGLIFSSVDEIPQLIRQYHQSRRQILTHCQKVAESSSARHRATSTLLSMGIKPVADQTQRRLAS